MQKPETDAIAELISKLGNNKILTTKEELIPFMKDASYITGKLPLAVCLPDNPGDISTILGVCNNYKINVTVRSGGTSLTGSSVTDFNGIIISTMNLNRILEINTSSRYAVCEPGVRIDILNQELRKYNFFYPPDPASSRASTIGGSLSTNAGGLRAVRYGATKEWVLGMDVVVPDGHIIRTGEYTLKRSAGYDITALMIGSEGTLGVITRAILKIEPLPEATAKLIAFYKDIESVGKSMDSIKSKGITPLIAEFMDLGTINSIRKNMEIDIPEYTQFLLMIDVDSPEEGLARKIEDVKKILNEFTDDVTVITDQNHMDKIYAARKGAYSALLDLRENNNQLVVIGDVIVPSTELASTMKEIAESINNDGMRATLFGHIGDGNIHANIFMDNTDEGRKKMEKLQMDIARAAIRHRGSVSAEHGIGTEKNRLLYEEYKDRDSLYTLEIMKSIKKVFDPNEILNRGKIFYEPN
ncbi:MAG: FAD-binding oxidoreductase [Ferroplasma sp.]|uniref:FAD-binding oxidoreductase n=1 Tax=Ferroplasma sp. TaxID=2591003 RepID=UPI0028156012|nr:FAD-binding oxidoreductase [Ferroplasma sp.]WMT50396.1 MAG: FAD-binding oxidoreductase [Ferroplasma sp.]